MAMLDYAALEATALQRDPYAYLIVPHFIRKSVFADVVKDFPAITQSGSFPLERLDIQGKFAALLNELSGARFRKLVEDKFSLALEGRGELITVRGQCARHNGKIHTDSKNKLITVLLYMNHGWEAQGGRLHILRDGKSLKNAVATVPPDNGTLLIFRRSESSWHGHAPFAGTRRVIQLNWLTDTQSAAAQNARHRLSALAKQLFGFARAS